MLALDAFNLFCASADAFQYCASSSGVAYRKTGDCLHADSLVRKKVMPCVATTLMHSLHHTTFVLMTWTDTPDLATIR